MPFLEEDEVIPPNCASDGVFAFLSVVPLMGWTSLIRWWYFGVSIPEINFYLSPQNIGLFAFLMSLIVAGAGGLITWKEPTVSNLGVNAAFPVVFMCTLFTAEKNFWVTCIIVLLSFLVSMVWGIRKYLTWKDRKYLTKERRRAERYTIFIHIRKLLLCFWVVGVVPWIMWNYFSVPSDLPEQPGYKEIDFSRTPDKSRYPLLDALNEKWDSYAEEERLSAVKELAAYECCERLGLRTLPVLLENKKEDIESYSAFKNRIVLDVEHIKHGSFSENLFDVVDSSRYSYQQELMDCIRELKKEGLNVQGMPDLEKAYQLYMADDDYQKGKISKEAYMAVIYGDISAWREKEVERLQKDFGWSHP